MTRPLLAGLLLAAALLPTLLPAPLPAQSKPATLFLVRHAERAGGMAADVPISEAGQQRAQLLARLLGEAGVSSIVVSDLLRTQQSAAPLAAKLQLKPKVVKASDAAGLLAAARAIPAGAKAVFVRHSNELAPLVEKLGGDRIPELVDTEFDRLLVITLLNGQAATVSTLRFGQ